MKRWLGCSLLTLGFVAGTVAAAAWSLISYHALLRETIRVEAGWSRMENIYQHRRTLAVYLADSTRGEIGDARIERALSESANRVSQIILSPEILSDPERLEELIRLDAAVETASAAVLGSLERGGARDSTAIELAKQIGASEGRLAEERDRFNRAVDAYNRLISGFPLSAFARVYGFRPMPHLEPPSIAPPGTEGGDAEHGVE